jgi:hypothetical protein
MPLRKATRALSAPQAPRVLWYSFPSGQILNHDDKNLMNVEEYDALPEKEGLKYELNEGEWITVTPSRHRVRDRLGCKLAAFVEAHGLGEVTLETDFRLSEAVVRIPDAAFVRAERIRGIQPKRRLEGAPDLVRKARQYLRAGARFGGSSIRKPAWRLFTSPASGRRCGK